MSRRGRHILRAILKSQSHECQKNASTMVTSLSMDATRKPSIDVNCHVGRVKPFHEMPGPRCYPFIGNLPEHLPGGRFHKVPSLEIDAQRRKEYGNIYKETIPGGITLVHVYDPNDVENIVRSDGKYPVRESFFTVKYYNKKCQNNIQGLLSGQMEEWRRIRENVQQKMLRPKSVSAYLPEHSLVADDLVNVIEKRRSSEGIVEDIRSDIDDFAAESIGVVCFNKRLGTLRTTEKNNEAKLFIEHVRHLMYVGSMEFKQLPLYRIFKTPSYKKLEEAMQFIKATTLTYSQIALEDAKKRLKSGEDVNGEQADLVPYLMSKSNLSPEQVVTVISDFLAAGVDTTSHHLCFALYLLATDARVQEKVYSEINQTIPDDMPISSDHIKNMSYIKAVVKETHRVLPTLVGTIRKVKEDTTLSGYNIPKGVTVVIHTLALGKDEKNFTEPETFYPERWLRSNGNQHHPFAFLPFGFGVRSCVGRRFAEQETYLAIIKILKAYTIEYVGETLQVVSDSTCKPNNKMAFRFTPR